MFNAGDQATLELLAEQVNPSFRELACIARSLLALDAELAALKTLLVRWADAAAAVDEQAQRLSERLTAHQRPR